MTEELLKEVLDDFVKYHKAHKIFNYDDLLEILEELRDDVFSKMAPTFNQILDLNLNFEKYLVELVEDLKMNLLSKDISGLILHINDINNFIKIHQTIIKLRGQNYDLLYSHGLYFVKVKALWNMTLKQTMDYLMMEFASPEKNIQNLGVDLLLRYLNNDFESQHKKNGALKREFKV